MLNYDKLMEIVVLAVCKNERDYGKHGWPKADIENQILTLVSDIHDLHRALAMGVELMMDDEEKHFLRNRIRWS